MKLRDWLDQECIEIKQLAEKIGVSRHAVHLWLSGTVTPLRVHRAVLQKITNNNVKIGDWDDEAKVDRRVRSSKEDGVRGTQCVDANQKAKPKGRQARR